MPEETFDLQFALVMHVMIQNKFYPRQDISRRIMLMRFY